MSHIIVHEATVGKNFPLDRSEIVEVEVDVGDTGSGDHLDIDLLLA
jgi:hypothetical protein